jgi:hypothetical protein
MCPTGRGRHCKLGLRKSLLQRRHDLAPQSISCQPRIRVRLVVDVADAMAAQVGIDGLARLGEPGTRPSHSFALGDTRHSGQAGRPAPAQGLQQKGFGLILLVMREQDQARPLLESHPAQSGVTGRACPRFHAVTFSWRRGKMLAGKAERMTRTGPTLAATAAVRQPGVGVRTQPVMHMQRNDIDAEQTGRAQRRMQQRGGVAPAAVGDRDPRLGHFRLSAPWCR